MQKTLYNMSIFQLVGPTQPIFMRQLCALVVLLLVLYFSLLPLRSRCFPYVFERNSWVGHHSPVGPTPRCFNKVSC